MLTVLYQTNLFIETGYISYYKQKWLSLNCHGFNDGIALYLLRVASDVDIIPLQETWLSVANYQNIQCLLPDYIVYHSSSMEDRIQNGILHGRPYGGTAVLAHKSLALNCFRVVTDNPRISVCLKNVNGADAIVSSIYMPWCDRSMDQIADYEDTIGSMQSINDKHIGCSFIFGGDLNVSQLSSVICGRHVVNFCVANDTLWLAAVKW